MAVLKIGHHTKVCDPKNGARLPPTAGKQKAAATTAEAFGKSGSLSRFAGSG